MTSARPEIILEIRKCQPVAEEGYEAHLVVGKARIFIERILLNAIDADDLHTELAKEFSAAGIVLVADWK